MTFGNGTLDKEEQRVMEKKKRILMALLGVMFSGVCVGILQKSSLGADPFTCFVTAFANLAHSTYSQLYVVVTGALLIGVFFVERHYIGIATIFNLFGVGMMADLTRNLLNRMIPEPGMAVRVLLLIAGVIFSSLAASLYFTADLGVSAYDAVSLIAANKYKLCAFRICRITTDLLCVITGFICAVVIGVGTVITALFMGPIIQWFNTHLSEPLLYGKRI